MFELVDRLMVPKCLLRLYENILIGMLLVVHMSLVDVFS